jgi:Rrf2 family nitric oxide-sensitive transcriptional repressor
MRLTTFSDYTLRVLIYLGVNEASLATIADIARAYGISENHLMKVVHFLGQRGYVETVRGKGGGMRLARAPDKINVGAVVRETEENLKLVECFDETSSECRIGPACMLRGALGHALDAFFESLDRHTLADLLTPKGKLAKALAPPGAAKRVWRIASSP